MLKGQVRATAKAAGNKTVATHKAQLVKYRLFSATVLCHINYSYCFLFILWMEIAGRNCPFYSMFDIEGCLRSYFPTWHFEIWGLC